MPTVPRYESPKLQTQLGPTPQISPNAPAEAFNIGQSRQEVQRAQDRFANTLATVALEEKKKADQVRMLEFDSELSQFQTQLEYGENGIYTKKGKDAFSIGASVQELWDKKTGQMIESLSDDEQKNLAKQRVLQRWNNVYEGMQKHSFVEQQKYDVSMTENFLKNSQNEAMESFANPKRVKQAVEDQKMEIEKFAQRNGLDEETKKLKLAESLNKTHAMVISKLAEAGNDIAAKHYFEANKDEITGEGEIQISKMLKEMSTRGESQRLSESIVRSTKTMSEAIEKAREVENPEVKDATLARVKEYYATKKIAERDRTEDLHKYVGNVLTQNGGRMDAIPPNIMSQFTISEKRSIEEYSKYLSRGQEPTTKWDKYYNLKTMAANPSTRDKFADLNLMIEARPYVDDQRFIELTNLQTGLRAGNTRATATLDGYMTDKQIVDTSLKSIGITPKQKMSYEKATRSIDERVQAWKQETGKSKIDNDSLRKIVDDEIKEGVVGEQFFFFDKKRRKFELEPGEQFINKTSPEDRTKAIDYLKANGKPVSEANINYVLEKMKRGK